MDHPSLELPGVALPLRHWQWGITPEMTPAAFLSEQAGFQQQSTCALTVVGLLGAGHYSKAKPFMEMAMSFLALVERSSAGGGGGADTDASGAASENTALLEVPEHAKRCAEDYEALLKAMETRSRSAGTGHALSRQLGGGALGP